MREQQLWLNKAFWNDFSNSKLMLLYAKQWRARKEASSYRNVYKWVKVDYTTHRYSKHREERGAKNRGQNEDIL